MGRPVEKGNSAEMVEEILEQLSKFESLRQKHRHENVNRCESEDRDVRFSVSIWWEIKIVLGHYGLDGLSGFKTDHLYLCVFFFFSFFR